MDVTKKLGEGFVALRAITEGCMALSAKVGPDGRDTIEEMMEKAEEVQEVFIALQEELRRLQQENHQLRQ